jgi:preprotein translocase subunit YajC
MDLLVFMPLFIILGAFLYFSSRRQKRAMQATIDLHESLHVGDQVHTTSGMKAMITGITEDYVDLEIAPGVVTTWMKLAIRDHVDPESDTNDETEADYDVDDASQAVELTDSEATADSDRLTRD